MSENFVVSRKLAGYKLCQLEILRAREGWLMRAQTVDVKSSLGRVLCCTIFRPGGKKLLAKGHVLSDDDVRLLEVEGLAQVWVTELEEGEIGEDEAVLQVATEIGCGSLEIRLAAGGRRNLVVTEPSCILEA